ncbi:hypothetical protein H4R99_003185 [Coemansia sp. RSA 1722]|nr:hypothetical protein H4R99_003185 [Coemansia sp. RSA 1722]
MGCRKCRGWEESECCLSQADVQCTCSCHTSCDCSFCFTVNLKARSFPAQPEVQHGQTVSRSAAASILSTVLRLESRTSTSIDANDRGQSAGTAGSGSQTASVSGEIKTKSRWSRRSSTLKPLRLFA